MADLPSMPLFVDDYEAATAHLTLEEDGAYSRLLRLCWRQSDCTIPDDDDWIMRRLRVNQDAYERVVKPLLDEFFTTKTKRIFQGRQVREHERVTELVLKRKSAGSRGGKSKSLKNNENTPSKATVLPEAKGKQTPSKAQATIPITIPIEEERKDGGADAPEFAFVGKVVRLKQSDYDRWKENYPHIPDLRAELQTADAYYHQNPPKKGQWFFPVSNWLKRANNQAIDPKDGREAVTPMGVNYGDP